MADKRPYAKIDTGYVLNPKWFQVERALRDAMPPVMPAAMPGVIRAAQMAHIASILYAAQNQTDGAFPVRAIKSICGIDGPADEAAITALFEVGLWINHPGGMAEVRDYLEHQTSAADIKATSDRQRQRASKRWASNASGNATSNTSGNATSNTSGNAEEKRREEKLIETDFESWYGHYPKKVGRGDALKAFKTARKKIDLETLIEATKRYAASVQGQDRKFIKNPGPWLRDERWADETGSQPVLADPYAGLPLARDLDD